MSMPIPEKRIAEFENFGFGIFMHWGLYSQLGKGEWIRHVASIPDEEYENLINTFSAQDFDPIKIATMAKDAGAKYMVLTTRHHEGFSLYDTKGLSDFDVMHSPAKRDLIKEYVDACNKVGIVPFFYHTTLDWHNKDFDNDFPKYLQYLRDSVEILCTNYGKIGGLWFDGNWSKPNDDWEEDKLYAVIRKHQPDAIIVNNTGLGALGKTGNKELDSVTFEQGHPTHLNREGMEKYVAAEMCQTMNEHWGVGYSDVNYKSSRELIETLCDCRKVGANYLLNIGPTAQGGIIDMQKALLGCVGTWIKQTGNGIYEGKPCGVSIDGEGRDFGLKTDKRYYIYVYDIRMNGDPNVVVGRSGNGKRRYTGIQGKVKSVTWTDNGEALEFTQGDDGLTVNCTGFPYGKQLVVRVAEIVTE